MWATLIPIIATHGFDFALKLYEFSQTNNGNPTPEQFIELAKLATTYNQRVEARAKALGVDPAAFKV